jgi:DNA-binding NarL/FixJ family response regulator
MIPLKDPRDRLIAQLAINGLTNAEIAVVIERSRDTVLLRMKKIYRELGITSGSSGRSRRELKRRYGG